MNRAKNKKQRRLFVIDIENIKGKAVLAEEDAAAAKAEIESTYEIGISDLVLIGTSHKNNFLSAKFAWPGAQHCFQSGHNGADVALIDAANIHLGKHTSFQEVVLFSGDGIFTSLMQKASRMGIKGSVISLANQINRNLARAAAVCTLITPTIQTV